MLNTGIRWLRYTTLAALAALAAVPVTQAQDAGAPSATVAFSGGQFGLILQVGAGGGEIVYKGGHYPFDMAGLKFGATIGPATTKATGEVYNLKRLADFEGSWKGTTASITPLIGTGGIWVENDKGVKMYIKTEKIGLELSLTADAGTTTFWPSVKEVIAKDPNL